jgi:hypothetical protein
MGHVVDTHSQLVHFEDDHELIENLARYAEGLLSKEAVKKKHRLPDEVWSALGENDRLVELIEDSKLRRIRTGQAKRELAQKHVVKAPEVLNNIMLDPAANAKHKIDSIKVLDQLADNGAQAAAAAARFVIQINLGADADGKEIVERYSKSIAINPDDVDPNDAGTSTTPPDTMIAAIATNKDSDDGGQGHI